MIDTDRASDGLVTVFLNGCPHLTRAGERKVRQLKAELGVATESQLTVRIQGRSVRLESEIMLLGGEELTSVENAS